MAPAKETLTKTYNTYLKLTKLPKGNWIFSKLVSRQIPYFSTINPYVVELKPNYCEISAPFKRGITNHIKSYHAIAMANACEFAMGMCMEASIPGDRRWIPQGMDINYLKICRSAIRCEAILEEKDWTPKTTVICKCTVYDDENNEVVSADIRLWISEKK